MDATFVESQPLLVAKLNIDEIADKFQFKKSSWGKLLTRLSKKKLENHPKYRNILNDNFKTILNHREYLISVVFNYNIQNNINFPVHIERIINNICKKESKSNISPLDIFKKRVSRVSSLFPYIRTYKTGDTLLCLPFLYRTAFLRDAIPGCNSRLHKLCRQLASSRLSS